MTKPSKALVRIHGPKTVTCKCGRVWEATEIAKHFGMAELPPDTTGLERCPECAPGAFTAEDLIIGALGLFAMNFLINMAQNPSRSFSDNAFSLNRSFASRLLEAFGSEIAEAQSTQPAQPKKGGKRKKARKRKG